MIGDPFQSCRNCRWWWPAGPALAAATRKGYQTPDVGACHVGPPVPIVVANGFAAVFPEVHADRFCGAWQAGSDVGDGGAARVSAEVLPFDRPAA